MTVAICLLLYSLVITVFAPRLLVRLTRAGVAPRLGIVAWLTAAGTVLASWAAATVTLSAELLRNWRQPGVLFTACVTTLHDIAAGEAGVLLQSGLVALAVMASVALASLAWRWGRAVARARSCTHRHASMARVVGRRMAGHDAVVLDAPERAAYCVAGRPDTIVVTSAALDALDHDHLAAVLAHERAHLRGRHHVLLAATRGLATTLPGIRLFTTAASEVATLLEICADDVAVRRNDPRTVLGALLALSGGASIPAGAMGAAGVGVLARAERLAEPPSSARRARQRLLLSAFTLLVMTGPALTALLTARGVASCFPGIA